MTWSLETRKKMSQSRRGAGNPNWKKKRSKSAIESQKAAVSGEKHYRWNPNREEIFFKKKQRKMTYSLLWRVLSRGSSKVGKTEEQLGYTKEMLVAHLESLFTEGMSWKNHGQKAGCWQIDHIKPVNQFPFRTSPSIVNALSNLRPLWYDENIRRARKAS